MSFQLSQRVQRVKPSATLTIAARAAELRTAGKDIISLSTGEPDFDTPEAIKQAAHDATYSGFTKYTPVDGLPSLKQAVVDKFQRENNLQYGMDQILVSCGAKHSLYNLMQALLDEGDEVIIPAPYWVSYPDMVLLADAKPVIVKGGIQQDFKITADQLAAAITDKTKLLILNSPSNPTGSVYTKQELAALGEVLKQHPHVLIVTDDIYEHIQWQDDNFYNIVNVAPELIERTVVINGVSKAYAMTGWRIGYAAGPADLIKAMKKIQSQSTSNPTAIAQKAAEAALNMDQACVKEMCAAYKQRHQYVYDRLRGMDGIDVIAAHGTFYSFPSVQKIIDRMLTDKAELNINNDVDFAEQLLMQAGVASVPGTAFGAPGTIRLSFATSMDMLEKALDRFEDFVAG